MKRLRIARQLGIAVPGHNAVAQRAHRTFPVQGTGAGAAVQLLIVQQGLEVGLCCVSGRLFGSGVSCAGNGLALQGFT